MGSKNKATRLLDAIKARKEEEARVLEAARAYAGVQYWAGRRIGLARVADRAFALVAADREVEAAKRAAKRRLRRLREEARNG